MTRAFREAAVELIDILDHTASDYYIILDYSKIIMK